MVLIAPGHSQLNLMLCHRIEPNAFFKYDRNEKHCVENGHVILPILWKPPDNSFLNNNMLAI